MNPPLNRLFSKLICKAPWRCESDHDEESLDTSSDVALTHFDAVMRTCIVTPLLAFVGLQFLRRDGTAVAFVSKAVEPNSQYRAYMEERLRRVDGLLYRLRHLGLARDAEPRQRQDKYSIIDPFMDGELGNETLLGRQVSLLLIMGVPCSGDDRDLLNPSSRSKRSSASLQVCVAPCLLL